MGILRLNEILTLKRIRKPDESTLILSKVFTAQARHVKKPKYNMLRSQLEELAYLERKLMESLEFVAKLIADERTRRGVSLEVDIGKPQQLPKLRLIQGGKSRIKLGKQV
jgi:hypothetical protein